MTTEEAAVARAGKLEASIVKHCCAAAYDSDAARVLLGDSFHPGGTKLTERLGQILKLAPRTRVLDVGAGRGASAIFLATRFGCDVVGVDYSRKNVEAANQEARANDLCGKVVVRWADAEQLPFPDASFDAVICECALCTFPDKQAAIREFYRVLRPHGQVGISDLTRNGPLARELSDLMSWIACIADAQSLPDYAALLSSAAFATRVTDQQNGALFEFVSQMRTRLLAAEVMVGLQKLSLPGFDFAGAKSVARHALEAVKNGNLGYAIIVASKMA